MKSICRISLLVVSSLLFVQSAALFVPAASAQSTPADAPRPKKKAKRNKMKRGKLILSGRHGKHKHSGRPA
jgi:hypothetical protein